MSNYLTYNPPAWRADYNKTPSVVITQSMRVRHNKRKTQKVPFALAKGWEVVSIDDVPGEVVFLTETEYNELDPIKLYLHYPGRVYTDHVCDWEGNVWALPKDLAEVFYVEDMWVPVLDTLECMIAKGYNAHVNDDPDDYNVACIGDLQGDNIRSYEKLVDMFRSTNIQNNYNNECFDLLVILVGDDCDEYNYVPGDSRMADRFFCYQGAFTNQPHPAVKKLMELQGEVIKPICCFNSGAW